MPWTKPACFPQIYANCMADFAEDIAVELNLHDLLPFLQ
jgi:hypothetical protein